MAEAVTIGSCTLYCGDLLRAAEIVSASAAGLPKSLGGDNEALASRLRAAKPGLLPGLREALRMYYQRDWKLLKTFHYELEERIRALEAEQSKEPT